MIETKHTPTPWRLSVCAGLVIANDGQRVANTHFVGSVPSETERAIAALIVRACNAHDDLLAALEAALTQVQDMAAGWPVAELHERPADTISRARAALAKARGE